MCPLRQVIQVHRHEKIRRSIAQLGRQVNSTLEDQKTRMDLGCAAPHGSWWCSVRPQRADPSEGLRKCNFAMYARVHLLVIGESEHRFSRSMTRAIKLIPEGCQSGQISVSHAGLFADFQHAKRIKCTRIVQLHSA